MTSPDRLRLRFGPLLASELRFVGLRLLRPGLIAFGFVAGISILVAVTTIFYGRKIDLVPDLLNAIAPIALILPWPIWRGDFPFGRAILWTMPVRRQQAACARIIAGAAWLLVGLFLGFLCLAATAFATGGGLGDRHIPRIWKFADGLHGGVFTWVIHPWMWLVPVGCALTLYLASSAVLLGIRHKARWLAIVAVAFSFLVIVGRFDGFQAIRHGLGLVLGGTYGLDIVVTGGMNLYPRILPGPASQFIWAPVPTAGQWALALLLWLGAALLALALALRRHWER